MVGPPGILRSVLDRPRAAVLGCAALCFGLFALLTVAVVTEWQPLYDLDNRGEGHRAWATDTDWLHHALRLVEIAFGTVAMTIYTVVLVVLLFRKHRRAAYFTAGVMIVTPLLTTLIKALVGRDRPEWQSLDALLTTPAYPSGHASGVTALGGVVMVLVGMLVRRKNLRRAAYAGVVLVAIAVYNPLPHSHAERVEPLPEVFVSQRRLAVIVNPIKVEDIGQFKSIVSAMAAEAGWSTPSWHYTT